MKWPSIPATWFPKARQREYPSNLDRFEMLCANAALLLEAENLAQIGSWQHDLTTGEQVWSANLCQMLGLGRSQRRVSEDFFWSLVHPQDRETVRRIVDWAFKDRLPSYDYQCRLVLADNKERVFRTRGKLEFDSSRELVRRMGVTQDVTLAVELNRALVESEERHRDLVENSYDLICTHDLEGRILTINEPPARLLGYSPSEFIGRSIKDLLMPEKRAGFDNYIQEILLKGTASGLMTLHTRNGEPRIWEYRNTLRNKAICTPIVRAMAHDITDRIRAEKSLQESHAELQRLSIRLVQLQDFERRRVSLTLHEKTAQSLAGLKMILGTLDAPNVMLPPGFRQKIKGCSEIAAQLLNEVGSLACLLHPPLLEEGLPLAVSWHVSRFVQSSGIQVTMEIPRDFGRLPDTHEQALFRIVQECLANTHRHSGSRWAMIEIKRESDNVFLVVRDGGQRSSKQSDHKLIAGDSGFGMLLMRERIRELNGTFSCDSSGAGFVVRTSLPLGTVGLPHSDANPILCHQTSS